MARGWDSKAVEDQISSAEVDDKAPTRTISSTHEREKKAQMESLLLSRTALLNRLKTARNERYRQQLELALEHVESKLRELK